jgi:hypothetical protein
VNSDGPVGQWWHVTQVLYRVCRLEKCSATFPVVKNLRPVDKFFSVLLIGFFIFVAGWLYGNQDFFYMGYGMCSDVWNPRPLFSSESKYVIGCSQGATARREQIFFVGFILFVLLSIGFLAISNSQDDESEV